MTPPLKDRKDEQRSRNPGGFWGSALSVGSAADSVPISLDSGRMASCGSVVLSCLQALLPTQFQFLWILAGWHLVALRRLITW